MIPKSGYRFSEKIMRQQEVKQQMNRLRAFATLAGVIGLAGLTQAFGQPSCRPDLAFKDVAFSQMQPPTMQRKWSAVVSVDAARCAANSTGAFEIVFTRLQEFGPDSEFSETFIWAAPEVSVAVTLAPTEAVQDYRIGRVAPCSCVGK
jgi:hypothetical protein